MKPLKIFILFVVSLFLVACADPLPPAPIVDGWQDQPQASIYRVQPGDTLYSIAWAFGVDYQEIARYNNLKEPYAIKQDQALRMLPPPGYVQPKPVVLASAPSTTTVVSSKKPTVSTKPVATTPTKIPSAKTTAKPKPAPAHSASNVKQLAKGDWLWPAEGKVAKGYSTKSGGNRGVDIAGKVGQPVMAAAPGKIVYTGSSMPGYGKLIIVKHNNNDLSAYAFNDTILVKEGQTVKAGEKIASMGKDNAGKPMLHFEVRKNGKPQNPLGYLKKA